VGIIDTDFNGWMSFLSLSLAVIEHAWVLLSAQTRDVGNHSVCLINAQYSLLWLFNASTSLTLECIIGAGCSNCSVDM